MKYDEYVARVRERGEYASRDEAQQALRAVLGVLGVRLVAGETTDLASQVPGELGEVLTSQATTSRLQSGIEHFLTEVATQIGTTSTEAARWDASAVLTTLAEGITGGELNQLLSQLPSSYAALFGHAELT